jgi:hypothetical protein
LAAEIDSGVDIVGGCWQLVGAAAAVVVARAVTAVDVIGLLCPKKYAVINMTRGIRSRPHETNSISLKDKYSIKNMDISPNNI